MSEDLVSSVVSVKLGLFTISVGFGSAGGKLGTILWTPVNINSAVQWSCCCLMNIRRPVKLSRYVPGSLTRVMYDVNAILDSMWNEINISIATCHLAADFMANLNVVLCVFIWKSWKLFSWFHDAFFCHK